MPLTLADVQHIAELAKLGLTPEEEERYRDQLSAILDYFARLQEVDTSTIPATVTVLPVRNVMRDDQVQPSLSRERRWRTHRTRWTAISGCAPSWSSLKTRIVRNHRRSIPAGAEACHARSV